MKQIVTVVPENIDAVNLYETMKERFGERATLTLTEPVYHPNGELIENPKISTYDTTNLGLYIEYAEGYIRGFGAAKPQPAPEPPINQPSPVEPDQRPIDITICPGIDPMTATPTIPWWESRAYTISYTKTRICPMCQGNLVYGSPVCQTCNGTGIIQDNSQANLTPFLNVNSNTKIAHFCDTTKKYYPYTSVLCSNGCKGISMDTNEIIRDLNYLAEAQRIITHIKEKLRNILVESSKSIDKEYVGTVSDLIFTLNQYQSRADKTY